MDWAVSVDVLRESFVADLEDSVVEVGKHGEGRAYPRHAVGDGLECNSRREMQGQIDGVEKRNSGP